MKDRFMRLDPLSRRRFVEGAAKAALGVATIPFLPNKALAAPAKAERCIFFYMSGGMSHIDTFDPKPGTDTGGQTKGIPTGVPGIELSEYLPGLAGRFKDIAVIRSMTQKTGDHRGGSYWMKTSYQSRATIIHPTMGPWAQRYLGKSHKTLPPSVVIGGDGNHPGAGFFGPTFAPLPIGDPMKGVQDARPWQGISERDFDDRIEMMNLFDRSFQKKFVTDEVQAYTQFYQETLNLMKSEDLDTFDLTKEPNYQDKLQKYGNTRIGQGALLAKRLVSSGIRFVEVNLGGWDMHNDLWNAIQTRAGELDQALANLIDDLKAEGLFDTTLIALTTEFGRTPKINANAGRDHHPRVFSAMMAGGGVRGGQVYGKSDKLGVAAEENPVEAKDFNATIATAMGIPLDKVVYSPSGRPFLVAGHKRDPKTDTIVPEGNPIQPLIT